jgi:hypothetical protein
MDFIRLNKPQYRAIDAVGGYKSLIWTERYLQAGEFELKTLKIDETMALLPLGSLVSITDSDEAMIVEDYSISDTDNGEDILTVTGRSALVIYESRVCLDDYGFYSQFDNTDPMHPKDIGPHGWYLVANPWNNTNAAEYIAYWKSVQDIIPESNNTSIIPNLVMNNQVSVNRGYYARYLERDNVYNQMVKLCAADGSGMSMRRPKDGRTAMELLFYGGKFRHKDQSVNARIILDHSAGDLIDVNYFQSTKNYRNEITFYSRNRRGGAGAPVSGTSGWDKREMLVDALEITGVDFNSTYAAEQNRKASELAHHRPINMLDAKVSPNIQYKYKSDYYIGDIITVNGKYGVSQNMRVSEYVRSEDENGQIEFPTISAL